MSTAKSSGAGVMMWPEGTNFETAPADLAVAINHAIMVLGFREMMPDDQPPRWMWHLDWEIEKWFKDLARKRENGNSSVDQNAEPNQLFEENELFAEMQRMRD